MSKLLNISFFVIPKSKYDFLRHRHDIDSISFARVAETMEVKYLKLYYPEFTPTAYKPEEIFFKAKSSFFHLPFSLYLFARREKPDVIFVHSFIFPFQFLFLRYLLPANTKFIIQHHAEKPFLNPIKLRLQKKAYARADAFLFTSKGLAEEFIRKGIIPDTAKVYEMMEGSTLFKPGNKLLARQSLNLKDEMIFLWVGRLDRNKDPLTVLKGFKQFMSSKNKFKLYMIYSEGNLQNEVTEYIKQNELAEDIMLLGKIEHAQMQNWFHAADYFVSGSHYEGSGYAVCEAMACGCVPVVTEIPSFLKMMGNARCSYFYKPGEPDDLYRQLVSLTEADKDVMSSKAKQRFQEELSFDAIGSKIKIIVASLLQK